MGDSDFFEKLHYILAICAKKEGEEFIQERIIDDRAKMMLGVRMGEVMEQLFFFAQQGKTSTLLTDYFLRATQKIMAIQK